MSTVTTSIEKHNNQKQQPETTDRPYNMNYQHKEGNTQPPTTNYQKILIQPPENISRATETNNMHNTSRKNKVNDNTDTRTTSITRQFTAKPRWKPTPTEHRSIPGHNYHAITD
jgi:hypothetical protein